MTPQITIPRKEITKFCRKHNIRKLSLFGSVLRDDFGPDSDIDMLAEFEAGKEPSLAGFVKMQAELSHILGQRQVDLATPSILRNPYRKKTILRDLQPIYGT